MTRATALAPAKVNLFLHVGPVDAEGYHPLASLVAFADIGDQLTAQRAERMSLWLEGAFATELEGGDDNLVLRALRALRSEAGLALTLEKALPIAAGLGGGSSDAGAALRLAGRLLDGVTEADLVAAALTVGADGPMCLNPASAWAEGRGERLTPEPRLPPLHAVLVNPRASSSTGAVYRAYDAGPVGGADRPDAPADWSPPTVIDWLGRQRNDLEAPALALQPAIAPVLEAVAACEGLGLARMSGSGATVFGLFVEAEAADEAARRLAAQHRNWWVRPTLLGGDLSDRL